MERTYTKSNIKKREVENTLLCSSWGVTPSIISYTESSIIMEKYDTTYLDYAGNRSYLNRRVEDLLSILHRKGYIHGDIHEENIVLKVDDQGNISDVKLIDFYELKKIDKYTPNQIESFCENDIGIEEYSLDAIFRYEMTIWRHY